MKRSELFFTLVLLPLDLLALFAAGIAAYYSRFLPALTAWRPVVFDLTLGQYLPIVGLVALVWVGVFALSGLYATRRDTIMRELARVALACSAGMASVFAILFFSRTFFESRYIAVAGWLLAIVFVCSERLIVRLVQKSLWRFGIGERRVALFGAGNTSKTLEHYFAAHHRGLGIHVVKHFPVYTESAADEVRHLARANKVDEILLADPEANRDSAASLLLLAETEHLGFRYTADVFASAIGRAINHTFAGIPVIEVQRTPLDGWGAVSKRIFDIIGSLILIIVTLPIQIIIAIALFLEQPGSVIFSRLPSGDDVRRVGQSGKPFPYFKFRSMIKDAHKQRFDPEFVKKYGNMREGSPLFKLKDDPRVTPVGRFLRKYSLDELPEFYLVLMGRMSLVGPRPHLPEEVAQYKPLHRKVLTIKPGITGMAQISGRADLDFDEEVRLDVHYIEHWSIWLDLAILLKTPFVVLFRTGAY